MEKIWTTADGRRRKFSSIGHQHLSNIYWFNKVLNQYVHTDILEELEFRFKGKILPWRPKLIPNELQWIKENCKVSPEGKIFWKGDQIGEIPIPEIKEEKEELKTVY
jgi:hypothetical protein